MLEAEKISNARPGSQEFLGSLQSATTKLWGKSTPSEQAMYVRLAKKWTEQAPPPEIQAR
jgi:hypothetical protein